jgi:hypothetical protein
VTIGVVVHSGVEGCDQPLLTPRQLCRVVLSKCLAPLASRILRLLSQQCLPECADTEEADHLSALKDSPEKLLKDVVLAYRAVDQRMNELEDEMNSRMMRRFI